MTSLVLRINVVEQSSVKTIQFEPSITVYDARNIIREKISGKGPEAGAEQSYGLFLPDEDPKRGAWLESERTLDYYFLKTGDLLEYKSRMRQARVRMMDESLKTFLVDDTFVVEQLVKIVCERIGITNFEEFSLVCEEEETALKKAPSQVRDQKRMEALKKKLHTQDDVNWLAHDETLRSQGISESQVLLLKKKFFFSDHNVDRNDPVQLNQLYAQARDAIVDGTHPCAFDEAVNLAALQCQIVFGKHDPSKHKPGYLTEELGSYLPKEYVKVRGAERRVFAEHAKFTGLSQLNAKFRYIQVVRSLKTYGVTFFLVKEKMKGKNKLVPRLLGITRESVMRVDERTKEVLKTWPLNTVRRWAASPNSFTLDFGDYSQSYYTMQTTEGEQISRLISGYIDIILKKKRATDRQVPEFDDRSTSTEYWILPGKKALQISIANSLRTAKATVNECETATQLSPLGDDPQSLTWKQTALDVSRHNVASQLAAITASAARMVALIGVGPNDIDYTAVGATVTTLSSNLTEVAKGVKMIAALQKDSQNGDELLGAARNLVDALRRLLTSAESEPQNRDALLDAAAVLGLSSMRLVLLMGDSDVSQDVYDALLAKAKAVALATSELVQNAKSVAEKCSDASLQAEVVTTTEETATATSELVACTQIIGSTVTSSLCQEQLISCVKQVAGVVEGSVSSAQNACSDDDALKKLGMSATRVTVALQDLLRHIQDIGGEHKSDKSEEQIGIILATTRRLIDSRQNAQETLESAQTVATVSSQMVSFFRDEASGLSDEDAKRRLLAAARNLADATAKMIDAAGTLTRDPSSDDARLTLRTVTENLRLIVNAAASDAMKRMLIKKLEVSAKHAASASTQLIAAAQGAGLTNRNASSQQNLLDTCKTVADQISRLVQAIRLSKADSESSSAQLALINVSQAIIEPCRKMIVASKAAVPTIEDQAAALQLANFAKQVATCLANLISAASDSAEACGSLELENVIEFVSQLEDDLVTVQKTAAAGKLLPLPGDTEESCALELGATSKTVGAAMAQLLTAAAQGNENYTRIAARDTADALKILAGSVRGIAATTKQRGAQDQIVVTAVEVMHHSRRLVDEAKKAIGSPQNPDRQFPLAQAAKAVSDALNRLINCLPGQRDVNAAIREIATASVALTTDQYPPTSTSGASFQDVQTSLSVAAASLNVSASALVANSRGTHLQLAQASKTFAGKYGDVINSGLTLAGLYKEPSSRKDIVVHLKSVSLSSSKLLLGVKALSADANAPNVKNNLAAAARAVTDAINALVTVCTAASPVQRECENALRKIQTTGAILQNPDEPVTDSSYFACLDSVRENSKILGEAMGEIVKHAKAERHDDFVDAVRKATTAVCALAEDSAQSAYLVAIADPSSTAAVPGLVDSSQFARVQQVVRQACEQLLDPSSARSQLLSAATVVAKRTSELCGACKTASGRTVNPVAKRKFVQSAKDVATCSANLIHYIKTLASDVSEGRRAECARSTNALLEAIDELVEFASAAEFASVPAQISSEARSAQEPIVSSGTTMLSASSRLIDSAKSLAMNPRDSSAWQLLASHSKAVSDAMKKLLAALKDKSPGQAECEKAIDALNLAIFEVDQASLAAVSSKLTPSTESTLQGFHTQMRSNINEVSDLIEPVSIAARGDPENLGHVVTTFVNYFLPLSRAAVGAASKTASARRQMSLLEETKTLVESALQLIYAATECGGNSAATEFFPDVIEAEENMKEAVKDLRGTLEIAASEAGFTAGMIEAVSRAAKTLNADVGREATKSFGEYQESASSLAKSIVLKAQDMVGKAGTNPLELGVISKNTTAIYCKVASDCRGALSTAENDEIADGLKRACQKLGDALCELLQCAGSVQSKPTDYQGRKELADAARQVANQVASLMAALQAGAKGAQACINATDDVKGIISDLDTVIMFASTGLLNKEDEADTFGDHREDIVRTAKCLLEDTRNLARGVTGSQKQLASAAETSANTIKVLADHVKLGAAALPSDDQETQVLLLNAVRDVASSLGSLIMATKNAFGKGVQDPTMEQLRSCAKSVTANVSSLLETFKAVDNKAARGVRALESAIDAIAAQLASESESPTRDATPEDVIRVSKGVTIATAKAVAAGNSGRQDDATAAANLSRKAIIDMLRTTKAAASKVEVVESGTRSIAAAKDCAASFRSLLQLVHSILLKPSQERKQKLTAVSKEVAFHVSEVVQSAQVLKGADWVDPHDPNVIAENELLNAAAAIEAAAKKLTLLKPRETKHVADETLNLDEQILEAARAIAAATGALIKSATAAQRELVAQGRLLPGVPGSDDSQWAEGLVSAARLVASATQSLCEAANAAVQGVGNKEKLVASANAVSSSTAQLLFACRVKADADSENSRRLQAAGFAVKKASENFVKAAAQSDEQEKEEEFVLAGGEGKIGRIREEIVAKENILVKQRELEEAMMKLKKIRRHNYEKGETD